MTARLNRFKDILSMEFEQRKYVRYLVKDNIFAALRGGFKKVGKVHDISIKGLGYSFLSEITQVDSDDHHTRVDIFSSENGFHLFNVPCRIVFEITDATPDENLLVKMSKCGLHFGELSKMQLDLLNFLIKNYTIKTRPTEEMPGILNHHVKTT
jgi:PilZ domain